MQRWQRYWRGFRRGEKRWIAFGGCSSRCPADGALLIIPPAIAKRLARNLNQMLVVSAVVAVLATAIGTFWATQSGRQTGPFIVIVAGGLFFASLLKRRQS